MADQSRQYLGQKAFEIGYAVLRIGKGLGSQSFADHLEKRVLNMVDEIMIMDYGRASLSIKALEYLIRLGTEVNAIGHQTSQVVIAELDWLNSAIAGLDNSAGISTSEIDLSGIFSKPDSKSGNYQIQKHESSRVMSAGLHEKEGEFSHQSGNPTGEELSGNAAKHQVAYVSEQRHSLILDKVRDLGYCRLKDLQELLPGVSERTVRYDLQKLLGEGLIERIGNGGPSTFYRLKREVV